MCQLVQRVWLGEWPDQKTEYLVLRNGSCACIRPIDHLKCSKATQLQSTQRPLGTRRRARRSQR